MGMFSLWRTISTPMGARPEAILTSHWCLVEPTAIPWTSHMMLSAAILSGASGTSELFCGCVNYHKPRFHPIVWWGASFA